MPSRRVVRRWFQPLAGAALLAALVWNLGAGPFLDGLKAVDARALAAAAAITLFTTFCCAWRWRLVARGLGLDIPLKSAVSAYYCSQFLNCTLPGGVFGDVHRGVAHGRTARDVGRALRAVAWERAGGQAVQLLLAAVVLSLLPSPVHLSAAVVVVVSTATLVAVVVALRLRSVGGPQWWARALPVAAADIRSGLLARRSWPGIVLASAGAVAGYTALFMVAARTAGSTAALTELLPLAVFVLLVMAVPANLAGWGPREGAAAWAFSAAGLGAAQGVSAAVVYGVLSLVACLPGAGLLVAASLRNARMRGAKVCALAQPGGPPSAAGGEGVRHG